MVRYCQVTYMKRQKITTDILNVNLLHLPGGIYGSSYPKQHSEEMQSKTNSKREDIFTAGYEAGYKACLDEHTSK